MHGGESLGDEVDREVGAAHPQVTDEVARLVHAFNLHKKNMGQVSYLILEFLMHFVAGFHSVRIRIQSGSETLL